MRSRLTQKRETTVAIYKLTLTDSDGIVLEKYDIDNSGTNAEAYDMTRSISAAQVVNDINREIYRDQTRKEKK